MRQVCSAGKLLASGRVRGCSSCCRLESSFFFFLPRAREVPDFRLVDDDNVLVFVFFDRFVVEGDVVVLVDIIVRPSPGSSTIATAELVSETHEFNYTKSFKIRITLPAALVTAAKKSKRPRQRYWTWRAEKNEMRGMGYEWCLTRQLGPQVENSPRIEKVMLIIEVNIVVTLSKCLWSPLFNILTLSMNNPNWFNENKKNFASMLRVCVCDWTSDLFRGNVHTHGKAKREQLTRSCVQLCVSYRMQMSKWQDKMNETCQVCVWVFQFTTSWKTKEREREEDELGNDTKGIVWP